MENIMARPADGGGTGSLAGRRKKNLQPQTELLELYRRANTLEKKTNKAFMSILCSSVVVALLFWRVYVTGWLLLGINQTHENDIKKKTAVFKTGTAN